MECQVKKAFIENYLTSMSVSLMGAVMPNAANHLDLDPRYRDVYGRPLMRMTTTSSRTN